MSETSLPPDTAPSEDGLGLFANPRFVRYCYAKFLSLLGQNALIYGLFIAVISEQESSVTTSAFVLASVVPSIILSLPGGLAADLLPKKLVLLVALFLRMLVVYWFINFNPGVGAVIGLTFLVWTAYQFFSPAESAALLAIVARERLAHATSFLQGLSLAAQLIGAGVVAPLAVKLLDEEGLYVIVLVCLGLSTLIYASIQDLTHREGHVLREGLTWWKSMPTGFRTITADPRLTSVTLMRVLLDTGMLMFIVASPVFIEDTLNSGAQNAIYIAIPGALGLALGLVTAPMLLTFVNARSLALAGFVCFTSVLLALPFVDGFAPEIAGAFGPIEDLTNWLKLSDAIVATIFLLPVAGFGSSLVQVAARTEVYRRVPSNLIAQVFATQSAMGSIGALVPTFLAGIMLDVMPVRAVLILIGGALTSIAVIAWQRGGMAATRRPPADPASEALQPETPDRKDEDWA
ncbi:MAG TPA: MFS transporter [Dehalococcoidia bacterium]|nr:MFS transporter [Dehalococcoidia bacterium]